MMETAEDEDNAIGEIASGGARASDAEITQIINAIVAGGNLCPRAGRTSQLN